MIQKMGSRSNNRPFWRIFLVGIDQLISSTSNFLVVWFCLTSLPTETFGRFSYAWSTIALFIVLSRALFGIPALLDTKSNDTRQVEDRGSSLAGTIVLGIIAAIVTLSLHLLGGKSETDIWILGLFLLAPLILFEDQVRYLIVATKKIKFAIFLDLLVLSCIVLTVLVAKNSVSIGWNVIFGLASGYLLASLLFVFCVPMPLNFTNLQLFIKLDFHRRSRLVSDAFLALGFGLVSITLIRVTTGDSGIAIYNGLVFLFGPVALVTVFLTLGLQSEVVRTQGNLANRHKSLLAALCLTPVLWILAIRMTPEQFVENLLGPSTRVILENSALFAISSVTFLILEVLNLFMRTHKQFDQLIVLRFTTGLSLILLILLSEYLNLEFDAIIWAFIISNLFAVIATAIILRRLKMGIKI